MAAAVADFRPVDGGRREDQEVRRRREPRADRAGAHRRRPRRARRSRAPRARSSSASPPRPATTTGTSSTHGRAKLARKGCDLLVVNEVSGDGRAFEYRRQRGRRARRGRRGDGCRAARKEELADAVWDLVAVRLADRRPTTALHAAPRKVRCARPGRLPGRSAVRGVDRRFPHTWSAPCHVACSPPSPSPRVTRTRSPTRSATRSSTPCSRRTRSSRVAVETLITTGQVHVAGEVTTAGYADIPAIVREQDPGHRLRLLQEGLRRRVLRRVGVDRRAVAGHRPGRRRRLRGARRGLARTRSTARAPATRA